MVRDDRQLSAALRALLGQVRLGYLWTESGPTDQAVRIYEYGAPLSSGETVMLQAAFALWNSANDKLSFARAVAVLDGRHANTLFTLVLAMGRGAEHVDLFIAQHSTNERKTPA